VRSPAAGGVPGTAGRTGLLGLGSNIGDRRARLQDAVDALKGAGIEVQASSSVYDTDPVGEAKDQPTFLNACVRIRTEMAPVELLNTVKRLEREIGRGGEGAAPPERHGPREIDIDILLLGEVELENERMTLPHEQLQNRRFVLIPAVEIDPEATTPGGARLADALAAMGPNEGVRWAGPPLKVR
jgi:2-amino-4-hydroxy-6-hydroxymethyldihydropteridine diphosphokinase